MKKLILFVIVLAFAVFVSGCDQSTETKGNKIAANENTATTAESPANTAAETQKEETETDSAGKGAATPTEAVKTFAEGMKEKDPDKVKSVLTDGSIKMLEAGAKNEGAESVDEFIKSGKGTEGFAFDGEVRNEKIDGDKATLEVKSKGKWEPITLIKQSDRWFIAFDQR